MHLPEVHKGDDLREVLTAENLTEVFRGVNRINFQQHPFDTVASGPLYAKVFSNSRLYAGSVVSLTKDAFVSVSMDYAVCVDTPVSMDDDPHQVLGIVVKDLRAGERGKAVVSGIAIGSVNVSDTSHQFAKVENGKLVSTDEEDAPIRLISAPGTGSQLCILMLGFGSGGVQRVKGPFDSILTRNNDEDEAETTVLRCYDSSVPNGELAGRIYNGSLIFKVNAQEWTVTDPGVLFLDVTYDPDSGYNALLGFDSALPVVNEGERRYILQLAEVYMTDGGTYRLGKSREPADVRITDRWAK